MHEKHLMWDKGVTNCLKPQHEPNELNFLFSAWLHACSLARSLKPFCSRIFSHYTHGLIKAIKRKIQWRITNKQTDKKMNDMCNLKLLSKHTNNQTNLIELWVEWARPRNTNIHTHSRMHCTFMSEVNCVLYQSFLQRFQWTFFSAATHRKREKKKNQLKSNTGWFSWKQTNLIWFSRFRDAKDTAKGH